ncbi:MAG: DNA-binding protein WhiA [Clostridia bacterium]|nr:DNA-binding protein WhiA [Clostridia bacterium]
MSFTSKVKDEICSATDMPACCYHAMTYGLLLCGRSFNSTSMMLVTEHEGTAAAYSKAVGKITGAAPVIKCSDSGKYSVSVAKKADRLKVLDFYGVSEKMVGVRINRSNFADECCYSAFIRGAFLACATMADPAKSYQLDFIVPYLHLSDDMLKLMQELEITAKMVRRKGSYVIYFKSSEAIEDMLMLLGAQNAALEIMQVKIEKDMRNKINRKVNFETANIDRSIDAAQSQLAAIRKLRSSGKFDSLSQDLRELAQLREQYPENSLKELGNMLSVSLSRSGVYHRLNKIVSLAEAEE